MREAGWLGAGVVYGFHAQPDLEVPQKSLIEGVFGEEAALQLRHIRYGHKLVKFGVGRVEVIRQRIHVGAEYNRLPSGIGLKDPVDLHPLNLLALGDALICAEAVRSGALHPVFFDRLEISDGPAQLFLEHAKLEARLPAHPGERLGRDGQSGGYVALVNCCTADSALEI